MPNFGNVLKTEVVRLARKELRKELAPLRQTTASQRRDVAALKRQLANLQRRIQLVERQAVKGVKLEPKQLKQAKPVRFVAKGLRSMRKRLGLSAADLARLIDVSEQSIYNWETKKAIPRLRQIEAIVALRGLGKRQAAAQLAAISR